MDAMIHPRDFMQVLARGLAVMEGFSGRDEYMTLAELAKIVALPRATVRRCLLTLKSLGYIETSGEKFFRLAPKVLVLAQAYMSSSLLPRIAQPVIERLSDSLNESCSVSILYGDQIIYVARSARRRRASLLRDVGSSLPAYVTSMGRVLLASLSESELDSYFARLSLDRHTAHSIVDRDELRQVIEKVRREEFCLIDQEFELDLRAIAVPIRSSSGRIVAALSINTEASRSNKRILRAKFLPELRSAASDMRQFLLG